MKSILLLVILVIVVSTSASAQFALGGHVNALFPIGDFSNRTQSGFGFDVEGRFGVDKPLMTSASIGYHSFRLQNGGDTRFNFTPITLSLLYALGTAEAQPYLGFGVGVNRVSSGPQGFRVTDSYFGVSPIVGLQYRSSEQIRFDLNMRYHLTFADSNDALTGLLFRNAAYLVFNLGVFYTFGQ
ncbi:outer membrane beta-barrel protein [Tunicatimonas pelagia]|uniref:outer membrane beta-barrel protein n=1 Tax=Tunicatimonas pelagia TaxID=931531 RepID=UPI002666A46C|nr:outer membrane beta-barrel protein [Tunicatimonas pelagia]WKN46196.1 outer membrane beta-barrel protein [Tunicatimonas pelagia]